jgi:response regulator RpfG family c-di-GMP phosphodiesterase
VDAQSRELLEIFCANVAITYEALLLREEIQDTQRSTVYIIGEAVERRSKETGAHVRRVGELAALLAELSGLRSSEVEFMRQAAPLHDVGKIGIPDRVLNKPGKLDAEEWEVMKTHSRIGFELLSKSDKRILQLGAIIAHEHHERWDGQGYPRGLLGEQIHIAGRIVALADVLDALVSRRCYKESWNFDEALSYVQEQAGLQFDPDLVAKLMANLPAVKDIYVRYPDS